MFENLNYAMVQLVHNFGAAAVVGLPILALYPATQAAAVQRRFAWLVGLGWAIQAASGKDSARSAIIIMKSCPTCTAWPLPRC